MSETLDSEHQPAQRLPWSRGPESRFDPRTEVSADALYVASQIVKHLWILSVGVPILLGLLLWLFGVIK